MGSSREPREPKDFPPAPPRPALTAQTSPDRGRAGMDHGALAPAPAPASGLVRGDLVSSTEDRRCASHLSRHASCASSSPPQKSMLAKEPRDTICECELGGARPKRPRRSPPPPPPPVGAEPATERVSEGKSGGPISVDRPSHLSLPLIPVLSFSSREKCWLSAYPLSTRSRGLRTGGIEGRRWTFALVSRRAASRDLALRGSEVRRGSVRVRKYRADVSQPARKKAQRSAQPRRARGSTSSGQPRSHVIATDEGVT
mmetsp:Transcript_3700/g.14928  ORF Transcript_3700/g.14928 Transcript_3700/m.14928 type:complete len:257 (-) Transcript_3700:917-1687(-)